MKKRLTDLLFWLTLLAALPFAIAALVGVYFAQLLINPPRRKQWKTPQDEGMAFESVYFDATDAVPLSAWFIPAAEQGPRPAVIIVHGWTWNRLGNDANDVLARLSGSAQIDLLVPARALHDAGYHVLMLDMRNHGRSGSSPTVTFGHDEAHDVLGAVRYLQGRDDVDGARIGVLGYSMGANTAMFASAKTHDIKAAIAVQPVRPVSFAHRLSSSLLGPLGGVALGVAQRLHYRAGGLLWETTDPAIVADMIHPTVILYVQGDGDPWGDVPNVRRFYEMGQPPVDIQIVPSANRFDGYLYLSEHPNVMLEFFERYLVS